MTQEWPMNWFDVPNSVTERVIARCGVAHPLADLDPRRTALIVVDLQNAFMDDQVGHAVCPMAREIVPNVNRLAAVVRATGGGVFWIRNTFDERSALEWSNAHAMLTPHANAVMTMEEHNASLIGFYAIFGDVMDTDFVIQRLTRND
jgi:ureidoacrylate peracid hydrolase